MKRQLPLKKAPSASAIVMAWTVAQLRRHLTLKDIEG
jgi:hypothetical protein